MSAPHPLNQAVIAQALHDLRNGQLRRCKAMGFGEEELDALKHPELVSMLVNATVSWCSVSVNREVLKRLLSRCTTWSEIATVDRMLRLGASTEMVSRSTASRIRKWPCAATSSACPSARGGIRCWTRRRTRRCGSMEGRRQERGIALDDEVAMLTLTMDLAEAEPADVGDLVGDTQLDRPGAGVGHGDRRRTPARWPRGAVGTVRRRCGNWCHGCTDTASASAAARRPRRSRGFLYSGNRHERAARAVPRRRLTPLERNAWQVFRLQLNDDGVTAFPTYDQLRPTWPRCPARRSLARDRGARLDAAAADALAEPGAAGRARPAASSATSTCCTTNR
jgi:hypothetical protein